MYAVFLPDPYNGIFSVLRAISKQANIFWLCLTLLSSLLQSTTHYLFLWLMQFLELIFFPMANFLQTTIQAACSEHSVVVNLEMDEEMKGWFFQTGDKECGERTAPCPKAQSKETTLGSVEVNVYKHTQIRQFSVCHSIFLLFMIISNLLLQLEHPDWAGVPRHLWTFALQVSV